MYSVTSFLGWFVSKYLVWTYWISAVILVFQGRVNDYGYWLVQEKSWQKILGTKILAPNFQNVSGQVRTVPTGWRFPSSLNRKQVACATSKKDKNWEDWVGHDRTMERAWSWFSWLSFFFDLFSLPLVAGASCRLMTWCPQRSQSAWYSSYQTWQGLGDCERVVCEGYWRSWGCGGRAHLLTHWHRYLWFHVNRCICAQHLASPDERRDREKGDRNLEESDPPAPEDN